MILRTIVVRLSLLALLVGSVATVPTFAGSAVIGSVAGSMNATIGGQSLLPKTTIFSGDSLQVKDGVAVVAVGNNSRVIFGRDTVASFLRDSDEVTVLLSKGDVSMLHPSDGTPVRVKAGEVSITPATGFKTLGEVAMLGDSLVITAKQGALHVDDHGTTKNVAQGQTIVVSPKTAQSKGGGAGWGNTSNTALEIATLGAAGTGAILGGIAMSRAGDANSSASQAASAASAAGSTASAAASAASAAASSAAQAALLSECLIDYTSTGSYVSPYVLSTSECTGIGSSTP